MPRYFFDLHNDIDSVDPEGKEMSGIDDAKRQALIEARTMLAESGSNGRINLNHFVQVRDDKGNVVHRVYFAEAVEIIGRDDGADSTLPLPRAE